MPIITAIANKFAVLLEQSVMFLIPSNSIAVTMIAGYIIYNALHLGVDYNAV